MSGCTDVEHKYHASPEQTGLDLSLLQLTLAMQGEVNIMLAEVTAKRRMHGEWPLHRTRSGMVGLDMSWTSTLQRLRNRPPRRLGQTHSVQHPGAEARHN